MGKGPALALLLAGPALSLPNMLVIRSVLGTRVGNARAGRRSVPLRQHSADRRRRHARRSP
jgi:hypothetical protein